MISPDTKILNDGSVVGTLYNIEGFKAFNTANTTEQSGHFFPFTLKNMTGDKMTIKKNGVDTKKDISFDKDFIFRVENNKTTFEVIVDEKPAIALNFTKATLSD